MATPETAPDGTIEVKDSRTGKSYTLPVNDGAIRANDLKQIKTPSTAGPPGSSTSRYGFVPSDA